MHRNAFKGVRDKKKVPSSLHSLESKGDEPEEKKFQTKSLREN